MSVRLNGAIVGAMDGAWRILKCHPFHPGGVDEPKRIHIFGKRDDGTRKTDDAGDRSLDRRPVHIPVLHARSPAEAGSPGGKGQRSRRGEGRRHDAGPPAAPVAPGAGVPSGGLAAGAPAAERPIEVRTPLFTARISTAGGGITSFLLREYRDVPGPGGKMLDLVGSKSLQPPTLSLYKEENRPPYPVPMVFRSERPGRGRCPAGADRNVLLTWESTTGVRVTREYVFHGGRYEFEVRVQTSNGSREPVSVRPGFELSQMFLGELAGVSYTFHGW